MNRIVISRLVVGAVIMGVLVTALFLLSRPLEQYLTTIESATTVTEANLVGPDGVRQQIELPIQWQPPYGEIVTRTFEFDLTLSDVPAQGLYLYFPYYEQRLQVWTLGVKLYDSRIEGLWNPLNRSTSLVLIPHNDLHPGTNLVRLVVESGPAPIASLSQIMAGSLEQLQSVYLVRSFLRHTVKPIVFGMQILLALTGLLLFALRPKDEVFGWLGLLMTTASVLALGGMANIAPQFALVTRVIYLLMPVAALSLLGFTLSLTEVRVSRLLLGAILAISLTIIVLTEIAQVPGPNIGYVFSFPFFIVCTLGSVIALTAVSVREPSPEVVLFLFSLVLLATGTMHDFAIRVGVISDGIFLSLFSRFFSVTAIAIFIVRRLVRQADALDRSADELRVKLWEKEAELESYFRRQKRLDEARLLEAERTRITADLHDGVAGHLTTIVALADRPEKLSDEIKQSARNALVDLRLVIDTMTVSSGSLRYYLGLFRDRCINPLETLGISVFWSMTRLPEIDNVPQEKALNIMRILQESVNNAIKHGNPTEISITGEPDGAKGFRIEITNRGGEATGFADGGGMGLANMRKRAHALGGSLDYALTETGASVVLTVPVSLARDLT